MRIGKAEFIIILVLVAVAAAAAPAFRDAQMLQDIVVAFCSTVGII